MVHTRSGKKTTSVEGIAYSVASEEEMDSPRSQGQQAEDDVDPQTVRHVQENDDQDAGRASWSQCWTDSDQTEG